MKPLALDKIASVTLNCRLGREVRVGTTFPCHEGDVVAVRVLSSKSTYDTLELCSGRFSQLKPGDVVAGALGHRRALRGFAGHLPERLAVGDRIHILNLGGVLGFCDSASPDVGQPFECEVLGQVLSFPHLAERVGVPANIAAGLSPPPDGFDCPVPVLAVVGTCMSAGKTQACTSLIQELAHRRLAVAGAKCTGVSLRRDILAMEDAGACATIIFTDLGVVTTTAANSAGLTRAMLQRLAAQRPDLIVLELGDGLLGAYGVDAILADPVIRASFRAVVLAAGDPVGAWGGVRRLQEEYGLVPDVVTGSATDNLAGTEVIERLIGVPAANARTDATRLANVVWPKLVCESASVLSGASSRSPR